MKFALAIVLFIALPQIALGADVMVRYEHNYWKANSQSTIFPLNRDEQTSQVDVQQYYDRGVVSATLEEDRVALKEATYQSSWGNWETTVGKAYLAWDWSYSRRPLDLFGQDQSLLPQGQWLATADWLGASRTWTVACTSDSETQESPWQLSNPFCALRHYQLIGALEWQSVAFGNEDTWGGGLGFTWVPLDALELHGSLRGQQEFQFEQADLSTETQTGGWFGLIGGHWTFNNETQVMVEWHYDQGGWTKADWQNHQDMIAAMPPIPEALTGFAERLSNPYLYRQQVFFRIDKTFDWLHPEVFGFWQPEMNSASITSQITIEPDNELSLTAGYKRYLGDLWPHQEGWYAAVEFELLEEQ